MFHILSLLIPLAFAQSNLNTMQTDEYTRRTRIVQQREYEAGRAKAVAGRFAETEKFYRLMAGFIGTHGGLKVESRCSVKREVCSSEGCRSDGHPYEVSLEQIRGQLFFVMTCSVELHDGLACRVTNTVNGNIINWNSLSADCVDQNLRPRSLKYPGSPKASRRR